MIQKVESLGVLACLARVSLGVFDFNPKIGPEVVKAQFAEFVARKRGKVIQGPIVQVSGGRTVVVTAGDPDRSTLSGIAKKEYGDWQLWPLIYDLNMEKIGRNPNLVQPGMSLLVLPAGTYSPQEQAQARSRASSWRNYR